MIESGEARNEAGLSHQVGFFRVTFKNFITLLKRVPEVIQTMEGLGDRNAETLYYRKTPAFYF
jgi:hypothetical protein